MSRTSRSRGGQRKCAERHAQSQRRRESAALLRAPTPAQSQGKRTRDDGRFGPALVEAQKFQNSATGAQTPREKTLRPTFSCTSQCSPAALTRRVRAASPGVRSSQPCGTGRICPVWFMTVLGAGPGRKVWAGMGADSKRLMRTGPAPPPPSGPVVGPSSGAGARALRAHRRACESAAIPQRACPVSQRPDAKSTSTTQAVIVSNIFATLLSRPNPAAGKHRSRKRAVPGCSRARFPLYHYSS